MNCLPSLEKVKEIVNKLRSMSPLYEDFFFDTTKHWNIWLCKTQNLKYKRLWTLPTWIEEVGFCVMNTYTKKDLEGMKSEIIKLVTKGEE